MWNRLASSDLELTGQIRMCDTDDDQHDKAARIDVECPVTGPVVAVK